MRELLMIPCSKKKNEIGISGRRLFQNSLNSKIKKKFIELHNTLNSNFYISERDKTHNKVAAFKRYTGIIYNLIKEETWEKLKQNQNIDMIIFSAYYGIIYWNEPISNYELSMKSKINGKNLNTWWKENNLKEILIDFIIKNDFQIIRSFLSNDYYRVIKDTEDYLPKEKHFLQYKYTGLGSGSNYYRAKDLEDIILRKNVICPFRNCQSLATRRISRTTHECTECGRKFIYGRIFKVQPSKLNR